MYRKFIERNFGNVHMKGFEYLIKACELYADGFEKISNVYLIIAKHYDGASYATVERDIRFYIQNISRSTLYGCLPTMKAFTNKSVVAAIVYEVHKERMPVHDAGAQISR